MTEEETAVYELTEQLNKMMDGQDVNDIIMSCLNMVAATIVYSSHTKEDAKEALIRVCNEVTGWNIDAAFGSVHGDGENDE